MRLLTYFPEYLARVKSYRRSFFWYCSFASNAIISVKEEAEVSHEYITLRTMFTAYH